MPPVSFIDSPFCIKAEWDAYAALPSKQLDAALTVAYNRYSRTPASAILSPSVAALYDAVQYPLLAAAEAGDAVTVARLLNSDADPNERTDDGWSALIMAAKSGHKSIVTKLLMADAAINPPVHPPTHTALRGAAISGQITCVQLLLDNEANPNQVSTGDRTPLMGAAMNGHADVIELLLRYGASASAINTFGETARAVAEAGGHMVIADRLRQHEAALAPGVVASMEGISMGQAGDMLAAYLESATRVSP